MKIELENDLREKGAYVNPIYLMADSGARGGMEQIRQLAGMRGLMAKPSGEIIETPIKSNFKEGLTVLEYFSSTHGARKGLADTALKTADSGYLTRKLADICQNMVVTTHDCGTTKGVTRGVVYRGERVEVSLADAIRGRVSRDEYRASDHGRSDRPRRRPDHRRHCPQDRSHGVGAGSSPQPDDLRSGTRGVSPVLRDGPVDRCNWSKRDSPCGIIAAQSIGEPGTQLTMRTFHVGGTAQRELRRQRPATPRRLVRSASLAIRSVDECRRSERRSDPKRGNRHHRPEGSRTREVHDSERCRAAGQGRQKRRGWSGSMPVGSALGSDSVRCGRHGAVTKT